MMKLKIRLSATLFFLAVSGHYHSADAQVRVSSLSDQLILIQTTRSNLVASVGPEGAALVGPVDRATSAAIADSLNARTKSPRRFVIEIAGLASIGQGDAGWDNRGALVVMQEFAVRRMSGAFTAPVRKPRSEFSQFFSLTLNGEPMHAVRQEPGYATSDALVHFEKSNVIYLGEAYSGDGYPRIDPSLGGTVEGMLKTLEPWTQQSGSRFVGARGKVASFSDIVAYRDMVKAVSEQVQRLKSQGRTIAEVLASRPTKAYDDKWGHGVVTAEAFVRDLYDSAR
jgi:cyclase